MPQLTAGDVIRLLELKPHPEGGHFRETFRDSQLRRDGQRSASTAIYFLLARGERSHWHRVDAVEVWHWHAGAPLALDIAPAPAARTHDAWKRSCCRRAAAGGRAGSRLAGGAKLGDWTLVGCTVAPGFEFAKFELAPKDWQPS